MTSRFLREPSEYMKQAYFPEWKPSKQVAKDLAEGKSIPSSQIPDPIVSRWAPAPYLGGALGFYAPIFRNHYTGLPSYYNAGWAVAGGLFGAAVLWWGVQRLRVIAAKRYLLVNDKHPAVALNRSFQNVSVYTVTRAPGNGGLNKENRRLTGFDHLSQPNDTRQKQ